MFEYFERKQKEKGKEVYDRVVKRLRKNTPRPWFKRFPSVIVIWMSRQQFLDDQYGTVSDWVALIAYNSNPKIEIVHTD